VDGFGLNVPLVLVSGLTVEVSEMSRAVRASLLALLLVALFAVPGAGATGPQAVAAGGCHLSTNEQRHLGASYVTSLSVRHTSCSSGKAVVRAYQACRRAHGWKGKCGHKVNGYKCTRHIQASSPAQYDAKVTCKRGAKRVVHTYTQNK
jgi:hypothetical protein